MTFEGGVGRSALPPPSVSTHSPMLQTAVHPALTATSLRRKVPLIVGFAWLALALRQQRARQSRAERNRQPPQEGEHIAMWRWASTSIWSLALVLLAACAGCSGHGMRRANSKESLSPEQETQAQLISERAQAAIDRQDLEQARNELLQLVAQTPGSAEAHQRLGKVLQLQGRLNEAEACFRRALELDPDYVAALIGLGNIEAARREFPSDLNRFETAIEIDPPNAEAHFACAGLLETMGRPDEALAAYFRALEFNPLHPEVSQRIGAIQLARNQPDQALARLDQAVDLAPENGDVRVLRGRAHLMLRHFPQAIADFRTAAEHLPDRADVYYLLAVALDADHRSADALKAAQEALRLSPDYADARELSQKLRR